MLQQHDTTETLQRGWRYLVGPGALLDEPYELLLAPEDVPVFLAATRAWPVQVHPHCPPPQSIYGAGCGLSRPVAQASAFGEAVERYSAWRCCDSAALRATPAELGVQGIALQRFPCYAASQYTTSQFHFRAVNAHSLLHWVAGHSWTHRRQTYLPTCLVYQSPCHGLQQCIMHTPSTGLACGLTEDVALLGGLCEVLERDAIMIAWLYGVALPRLLPPREDAVLADLYQRIDRCHARATVLDATLDTGLPVRIAMLESPAEAPAECAIGMAAHPDPLLAHRKALVEACHTLHYVHQLKQRRHAILDPAAALTPQSFEDHVFVYGHAWAQVWLACWRQGPWCEERPGTLAATSPTQQFEHLTRHLATLGLEVLSVDLTPPDVAGAGFHVVRVVVPGLVPMMGDYLPALGPSRLQAIAGQLPGTAHYGPQYWNPYPHPFP